MYEIPTYIQLGEQSYAIREQGDYRMVLDCFKALNDDELSIRERIYSSLIIFYDDMEDIEDLDKFEDINEAIKAMYVFFNCGGELIEEVKQTPRLIDWEHDEQLICSAINKVAGQEIRSIPYIHWWTFMGWYLAIGESPLSHIVGIRHKLATNQKLEKYEKKFQQENPQYFTMEFMTEEDREYEDFLKNVWNKGD